jgi:hypothetical protein
VPELVLQRSRGGSGNGGKLLVTGGVPGMDQAAQRPLRLDRPDGVRVGLRAILVVAQEVGQAGLVPGEVLPGLVEVGWAARRGPVSMRIWAFSVQPPSKPDVPAFRASGFPAIYAACVTGFTWIQSWQAAQTMRVLRRIFAMSAAHAGWPGPGFPSVLRPVTW